MRIEETGYPDGIGFGGAGGILKSRIRDLQEGEALPPRAKEVPDETPAHDWTEVREA